MNISFPGHVADSGTYALIGASALLGGMARMTIAGCVIVLEASGNITYLLPLMITFAAARYTGNAINQPMYDMQISLRGYPFLEGALKTLGLLNYHPVAELMSQPVIALNEINRVSTVHSILANKSHNGFPVVGKNGHLKGFILRKTLCTIIKLKAFSVPTMDATKKGSEAGSVVHLSTAATVFHDTLERNYPHYPKIEDITLSATDMQCYLDVRPYMDTAPYSINASASVQRCYRFFRTMGLRHLVVLDNDHRVTGIITRKDIAEHRLEHHWFQEGDNMQKFISLDPLEPSMVAENVSLLHDPVSDLGEPSADERKEADGREVMESFEVSNRPSDSSFSTYASSRGVTTFSPPPAPEAVGSYGPPTAPSRTREQKAMKEPKSIRK